MTEDEIGDVGNRGVNQRESHSFFESRYRLVVYSVGWLSIHHHIEIRNLRRFPLKMMNYRHQQISCHDRFDWA